MIGRLESATRATIQCDADESAGPLGTHILNRELQALRESAGREIRSGDRTFREGDRGIPVRKHYDKGVFNGSMVEWGNTFPSKRA